MKRILYILLVSGFLFVVSGCSGGGSTTPESLLSEAESLVQKGFDMTSVQRQQVEASLKKGRELLAAGKKQEAAAALLEAVKTLKFAQDADSFNKSE